MRPEVIGTYTLDEAKDFRRSYECAAWYKTIRAEPQTVEAVGLFNPGDEEPYYVTATLAGVCTDSFFPALWGGVAIRGARPPHREEDIGKDESHAIQPYGYGVARAILEGQPGGWVLDGWEAATVTFEYDGEDHHTTGLVRC